LALERAIEILGEAASRIPPEWRARHPDLPWREMIGTRHRLAHGYFATELFILHEVATLLLPRCCHGCGNWRPKRSPLRASRPLAPSGPGAIFRSRSERKAGSSR
jgi:hypothetical protein